MSANLRLNRRTILKAGLATSAIGLTSMPRNAFAQQKELPMGLVRPVTGKLASSFAPLFVGAFIATKEINANGGILGHQIKLIEEDDEGTPAKQPTVMRKLQDAGVKYVLGPSGSSQALASLAVTTPAKMIQACSANSFILADAAKYPYHYLSMLHTIQASARFVDFLVTRSQKSKIGILQESTAFGEQGTEATLAVLDKVGLKPVDVQIYPLTAPDLNGYISNLHRAGADSIVFWNGSLQHAAMALTSIAALNWEPPIVGHSFLLSDALFDLVPPNLLKNVYASYYRGFTYTPDTAPAAANEAYVNQFADYPETRKVEAIVCCAPFYDWMYVLKAGIEKANSLDTDEVRKALNQITGHKGLMGTISFSETDHAGMAGEDVVLAAVASGRDPKAKGAFRELAPGS